MFQMPRLLCHCLRANSYPSDLLLGLILLMMGGIALAQHRNHFACPTVVPKGKDGPDSPLAGDSSSAPIVARLASHKGNTGCIAYSPDNKIVLTSGLDGVIRWWGLPGGENRRNIEVLGGTSFALCLSRNGRVLACGDTLGNVYLWNTVNGDRRGKFPGPESKRTVKGLAFSPDDTILAVAAGPKVHLQNLATTAIVLRIDTGESITALAWNTNGNILATGHHPKMIPPTNPADGDQARSESSVQLWDAGTGRRTQIIRWGKGSIFALGFSPDGRLMATGDDDPTGHLLLWDTSAGCKLADITAHPEDKSKRPPLSTELRLPKGGVRSIAFSPDGRLLVSGGGDGVVRLWETASAKELYHFDPRHKPQGLTAFVFSVAFAPDGNVIASAHEQDSVLLWDVRRVLAGTKPLPATLAPTQLKSHWAELAGPNPLRAYRAIEQLRAARRDSLPFVRDHCRPLPARDPSLIARWIADLDSEDFSVREKASRELASVADQAETALRKALAAPHPSKEAQRRIRDILSGLDATRTSPDRLRLLRVCRLLEQIGTAEARQVVESLAKNDARRWLSEEAKSTLRRMKPSE